MGIIVHSDERNPNFKKVYRLSNQMFDLVTISRQALKKVPVSKTLKILLTLIQSHDDNTPRSDVPRQSIYLFSFFSVRVFYNLLWNYLTAKSRTHDHIRQQMQTLDAKIQKEGLGVNVNNLHFKHRACSMSATPSAGNHVIIRQ